MSAKPGGESGSGGRWLDEDAGSGSRFGPAGADLGGGGAQPDREGGPGGRPPTRPPVAMETASTGSGDSLLQKSVGGDDADLYTSLLSGQSFAFQPDTSYFSGELPLPEGPGNRQQEEDEPALKLKHAESKTETRDRIPSLESHGMFSSDSGIEMTPGESIDVAKNLILESEKMEPYNYLDISSSEGPRGPLPQQPPHETSPESWTTGMGGNGTPTPPDMLSNLGDYSDKTPPKPLEAVAPAETLGAALDEQAFPYVEDPSDEELSDYQSYRSLGTPLTASPVRITLTQSSAVPPPPAPPVAVSEKESILSLGLEGVPTVTLSEPEDDSPGSSTPPLTEESESLSEASFQADQGKPDQGTAAAPCPTVKPGPPKSPASPALPTTQDPEASSAESGDSEIELVSEEPPAPEELPGSGYMSFGQMGGPLPSPASPSIQYSILREEREAELDSELIIESCDASSASDESPKRDQDSPAPRLAESPAPPVPALTSPIPPEPQPGSQRERQPSDRGQSGTATEDRAAAGTKPQPAPFLPPEVRVEPAAPEDKGQKKPGQSRAAEGRRESARDAGADRMGSTSVLRGFDRQKAIDLLYWRDLKQTGILFGSVLLLLFSLTQFSVVSVIAYLALAALSATISFRIYKSVLQAVQKTDEGHPFKSYLDVEISLSQEQIQKYADNAQSYVNNTLKELRRLFLVQDLVDSLKFAVLMWLLTYVGALFNGLTLMIMAVVSMFTMPVVYEKYQAQIDQYLGLVRTHVNSVVAKIQAKIPGAKRKAE
ncbi:reticulon-1a isoform X1 [Amia ocellicauda]|uniref:reticulon-1a isoform X1 n=1 Tax=Amia ocellicauda TaxID=2972642 RepID=UPI003463B2C5